MKKIIIFLFRFFFKNELEWFQKSRENTQYTKTEEYKEARKVTKEKSLLFLIIGILWFFFNFHLPTFIESFIESLLFWPIFSIMVLAFSITISIMMFVLGYIRIAIEDENQ